MKKLARRLRGQAGLTFTELLATVLILSLATSIVAAGVPSAVRAYRSVVDGSNAQVLLSTTTMRLRNELEAASSISIVDDGVDYLDSTTGLSMHIGNSDKGITITVISDEPEAESDEEPTLLVSEKTATNDLYMTFDPSKTTVSDRGIVTFHDLQVKKTGSNNSLATLDEFAVQPLIALATQNDV